MTPVLIAAVSMTEDAEPCLDIYTASTREEADEFIRWWNASEVRFAQNVGGYPGMALVVEAGAQSEPGLSTDDELTAEVWLANRADG